MEKKPLVPKKLLLPFIVVTSLFALWGFANDITNPLVAAFGTILELPARRAALIQFAFYGGYATMAFPAALYVRKHNYKQGILLGLALYAIGALLFFPAAQYGLFSFFLIALYILTFGLAFLETTANPFILSMGDADNATRRLNLSQSFNPIGSLLGMLVASQVILSALQSDKVADYAHLDAATKASIRANDLLVIRNPYVILGLVVIALFVVMACLKIEGRSDPSDKAPLGQTFRRLLRNRTYRFGVLAQVFYVGAQIMVWTFIIHYAERLGYTKTQGQYFNMLAMGLFVVGRFTSTLLMKSVNPRKMLVVFSIGAMACSLGAIFLQNNIGLYCLIGISAFMSLMFPTIYGIALEGLSGEEVTLGAAGLVEAIVGGALMPPLQGAIIDLGTVGGMPAVNVSFALPFLCFTVVLCYGLYTLGQLKKLKTVVPLLAVVLTLSACQEELDFPEEPQLTYQGFQYLMDADSTLTGEGILTIGYTDGDGDLGLDDADTLAPFGLGDPFYYNLLVDYYRWDGSQFVADTVHFNARFKRLIAGEEPKPIQGTIDYRMTLQNPLHPNDTVQLQIRIVDRALHVSNTVVTEPIHFNHHIH